MKGPADAHAGAHADAGAEGWSGDMGDGNDDDSDGGGGGFEVGGDYDYGGPEDDLDERVDDVRDVLDMFDV